MKLVRTAAAFALLVLAFAQGALAQSYPSKPIRIVVPYPAGGGIDLIARAVGAQLTQRWGQPVVVENKPGSGTIVAADGVAKSAPDGHTLLLTTDSTMTINPHLYAKLPYDPVKDFAPVTQLVFLNQLLLANPAVPANNLKELIAYAKARPGELNYGTSGLGSGGWLSVELFSRMTVLQMTHVPYKGAGQSTAAVLGNEVHMLFTSSLAAAPYIKSGRLRALGVTSSKRVPSMENVPALAEFIPGYEVLNFFGVLVPAGTPKPIISKLNAEINRITALPDVREQLASLGFERVEYTPEQFTEYVKSEMKKWSAIIRKAGIKANQ